MVEIRGKENHTTLEEWRALWPECSVWKRLGKEGLPIHILGGQIEGSSHST